MIAKDVLVLNQNYEPLTVCKARRAIVLVYRGKAELVESYEHLAVHAMSFSMPLPSVLRLNYFVRLQRKEIPMTRRNMLKRDRHQCQYCGKTQGPMTADHVVPRDMGGKDTWENLVCACDECNTKKANRTPQAAGMKLLRRPKKPHYFTFVLQNLGDPPVPWRPYLFLG
jgi:5-methylcytosine-specific restriction endonuclease McrA